MSTDTKAFPMGYHGPQVDQWGVPKGKALYAHNRRGRIVNSFIESLPQNAKVLDVGCGVGKTGRRVLGLRPDVTMYGLDSGDVRAYLPESMHFTQGSAEELPKHYDPNFFDAVICQHLIEHLLYPMHLIEGIASVLKPGGVVYLETPNWTRLFVPFSDVWFWNDYTHIRPYAKKTLHRLFTETGFSVRSLYSVSSFSFFPHREKGPEDGAASQKQSHVSSLGYYKRSFVGRLANRILNPLLKDILIGIAQKSE